MVWSKKGRPVAIELQHTPIGLEEIEERAFAYAKAGIAQIWIPFLRASVWEDAEEYETDERSLFVVQRYSARPFEKWIHGFNLGVVIYFDAVSKQFWAGNLDRHLISSGGNFWYDDCGEEHISPLHTRSSRRWRKLTLTGPYDAKELRFKPEWRASKSLGDYRWPSGGYVEMKSTPVRSKLKDAPRDD